MTKVLRNTNFKLNNGFLDYGDVAEIEVEKTQLATRTLQYGDIILEKSGGSDTQAIGRVVLFDKTDNETYSYSNFCSRIRVLDTSEVDPLYLWIVLHNFYCKGGTIPLQNGIRLLNIDMNRYSKIKIPVPPIDVQKQIVEEISKVDEATSVAESTIVSIKERIENLCLEVYSSKHPIYKLRQIAITNPPKSEIKELEGDTIILFIDMASVSNDGVIINKTNRLLSELKKEVILISEKKILLLLKLHHVWKMANVR